LNVENKQIKQYTNLPLYYTYWLKMNTQVQPQQPPKTSSYIFTKSVLTMKVHMKMGEIGKELRKNLETKIRNKIEGKCISEGYVRPNSVKVTVYSSGNVAYEFIEFQAVFECDICHPVQDMNVECKVVSITRAGIQAEVKLADGSVPLVIYVARDHNYSSELYEEIQENQTIVARIRGVRYELNDPSISAIATLVNTASETGAQRGGEGKPKIMLLDELHENDDGDNDEKNEPYEED
jgi:DNA-directed RNA polymerase subunit E'/Rpb7